MLPSLEQCPSPFFFPVTAHLVPAGPPHPLLLTYPYHCSLIPRFFLAPAPLLPAIPLRPSPLLPTFIVTCYTYDVHVLSRVMPHVM